MLASSAFKRGSGVVWWCVVRKANSYCGATAAAIYLAAAIIYATRSQWIDMKLSVRCTSTLASTRQRAQGACCPSQQSYQQQHWHWPFLISSRSCHSLVKSFRFRAGRLGQLRYNAERYPETADFRLIAFSTHGARPIMPMYRKLFCKCRSCFSLLELGFVWTDVY